MLLGPWTSRISFTDANHLTTPININTVQKQHIMDRSEKISLQGSAHSLRVIDILAFIPGMVLLLITALTTPAGSIYLIAVAPLTLSALLGLVSVAGKDRPMPPWTRYADLWLAMFFVSVLVPMYV